MIIRPQTSEQSELDEWLDRPTKKYHVLNRKLIQVGIPELTFVSADKALCKAAGAEGLRVVNPDEM